MNKRVHRLVFDRKRGMRVPAAEHVRAAGKPGSGNRRAVALALVSAAAALAVQPDAALAQSRSGTASAAAAGSRRVALPFASSVGTTRSQLPQPYGTVSGRTDRSFVANPELAGRVSWKVDGRNATFDQGDVDRVVLNWDSFDLGPGYSVYFKQNQDPSRYVSALNKIWSNDPSVILGSIKADREVILLNANGIYFGRGARVDTGKFVASTLSIANDVFERGLRNVRDGSAVFRTDGSAADYVDTNLDAGITVEDGALIRTAAKGDVLLIAPRVVNQGRIETPDGQTVLAAGNKVYLMGSSDPAQRGLIVAVDPIKVAVSSTDPDTGATTTTQVIDRELGIVENAGSESDKDVARKALEAATGGKPLDEATAGLVNKINAIVAERGTINLVGLTVKQNGVLQATTAVKGANGAIYLQAQESTAKINHADVTIDEKTLQKIYTPNSDNDRGLNIGTGNSAMVGERLGTVEVGARSVASVLPVDETAAAKPKTQLDSEAFNRSRVSITGADIHVDAGARVHAVSGTVDVRAAEQASTSSLFSATWTTLGTPDSSSVQIDSGATISVAGLRGVKVDGSRNQGELRLFRIELADAPVQRGGALYRQQVQFNLRDANAIGVANVAGAANAVARDVRELSTKGGEVRIEGEGKVAVGQGANIDISGGSVDVDAALIKSSTLTYQGRAVTIAKADRTLRYDGIVQSELGQRMPAYTEGKDGGSLSVIGRSVQFGAGVKGDVVEGDYQRGNAKARPKPASITFGKALNGGYYLERIRLNREQAGEADPSTLDLSLAQLQDLGAGLIGLRANLVEQQAWGELNLGAGGGLDVLAGGIVLNGRYTAPGGSIKLKTQTNQADDALLGDIKLSANTSLDVAGRWTNDVADAAPAVAQADGGNIDIAAYRSVLTEAGAALDVSAGAWLKGTGKTALGKAGSLNVQIASGLPDNYKQSAKLGLGASLAGYDFNEGGTLTLGVPRLTITDGVAAPDAWVLGTAFFSANGFGNINVNSLGDITLASGTQLKPTLRNWVLGGRVNAQASGAMRADVAAAQTLDKRLVARKPVNLSLAAALPINSSLGLPGASVHIERGAGIVLDAGGKLTLQATRNVDVGVTGANGEQDERSTLLQALGGQIKLATNGLRGKDSDPSADPAGFVADQAIWLGRGAKLSVSGTAELRDETVSSTTAPARTLDGPALSATAQPRQVGEVLGGGGITLNAARGYVIAEEGSTLALDGHAATVNLPGLNTGVQVAKSAGTLSVYAAEGFVLDGAVSAKAPDTLLPMADGGRLELSVGSKDDGVGTSGAVAYPDPAANPRQIVVGSPDGLLKQQQVAYGDALDTKIGNGTGHVTERLLNGSGFDAVKLSAYNRVLFAQNTWLHKKLSIQIDTPVIKASPGVQVHLAAPKVDIGDTRSLTPGLAADAAPDESTDSPSTLSIDAQVINVVAALGLSGFGRTELHATQTRDGEVRLMGTKGGGNEVAGALNFAGTLDVQAGQVYTPSGTRFTVTGLESWNDAPIDAVLNVGVPEGGSTSRTPLSAFGDLRLKATDINQGGVIRQPFGAITLDASRRLTLGAGSVTSVSGDGVVVPFGTTQNLSQWLSPFSSGIELTSVPLEKGITLKAPTVSSAATAMVSAHGGGDVQASEFFAGVGGSKDYFETDGLYAVLPDYRFAYAPVTEGAPDLPANGRQIQITMAGSGLAPGRYTLLPARYALLAGSLPQGAYLVSLAADQGSKVLTRPLSQDDGSTIVTGYLTQTGSSNAPQAGQRFVVENQATFRAKSDIRLSGIGNFLTQRAAALGQSRPVLPRDAGAVRLQTSAASTTQLLGRFDLGAPKGSRAGAFDIVAPKLALVDDVADTPEGYLGVSAAMLADSGAGSVLLGGVRALDTDAQGSTPSYQVDTSVTTDVAVLAKAAPIKAEELILAGSDTVDVADGVQVQAGTVGTQGPRTLAFKGDGALLAVSANGDLDIQRSDTNLAGGTLSFGPQTSLSGALVQIDATGSLGLAPSTQISAQSFGLGAKRIVLGDAASSGAGSDATVLDGALLSTVTAAQALTLRSYSSIDFVGEQNLAQRSAPGAPAGKVFKRLVLDAPTLRGVDRVDADGNVLQSAHTDLAAQDVVLRNTTGKTAADAAAGAAGSSLHVEAQPPLRYGRTGGITIGPGRQTLAFGSATLQTPGDVVLSGNGGLNSQGDLKIAAARVTATSGAEQSLQAAHQMNITRAAQAHSLGERVGQGAKVKLAAQTIVQDGVIDLPSGMLSLQAAGTSADSAAITFTSGSQTRATGFGIQAQDGWTVYGSGGRIAAQADQGRIDVLGKLDVSAAAQGDAGSIALSAAGEGGKVVLTQQVLGADGPTQTVSGELAAHAGQAAGDLGGRFDLDVQTQGQPAEGGASVLDELAGQLAQGGFTREQNLRVRQGNVELKQSLQAARITVTADQGSLAVNGKLDAQVAQGGVVQLAARDDLKLGAGAQIDARSSREGANGGDVLLASTSGRVRIDAAATVQAGDAGSEHDAQDGRIVLRAQRGADNQSVKVDALNTANLQAGEVIVEAVKVYKNINTIAAGNSSGSTLGQTTVKTDSTNFMKARDTIAAQLGIGAADKDRVRVRAGVEVQSTGNLTLNEWNLQADRPGGDAGMLTIRAAGNLDVKGSLSDGFATAATTAVLSSDPRASSYRLVAGADTGSANLMATQDISRLGNSTGNLTIAAGKVVRTGAGSIEMTAGRDVVFSTGAVAYVAGRKVADVDGSLARLFAKHSASLQPSFTERGGRIEVRAGRNVTALSSSQLVNNWLTRVGMPSTAANEAGLYLVSNQLAWFSNFSKFQQGLGSFGGGNALVRAGQDITNLGVMAPTAGWADSRTMVDAHIKTLNGGNVDVQAGGSVIGGQFLVGRGEGRIEAGDAVAAVAADSGVAAVLSRPMLALMDGQWRVQARGDIDLGDVFNPTAVALGAIGNGYYYTYGQSSALKATSTSGSVSLTRTVADGNLKTSGLTSGADLFKSFDVAPPTISLAGLGGDVNVTGAFLLYPSSSGDLKIYADQQFNLGSGGDNAGKLVMMDLSPDDLPNVHMPIAATNTEGWLDLLGVGDDTEHFNALPHSGLHAGDTEPVRIHAGASIAAGNLGSEINVAKRAEVSAGADIVDLNFFGQNQSASDLTRVNAQGNLINTLPKPGITLAGPGRLEVQAGRQLDLGNSVGIKTTGNEANASLPAEGASAQVAAAMSGSLNLGAFTSAYLQAPEQGGSALWESNRAALLGYVRGELLLAQDDPLSYDQALALFANFPAQAQQRLARTVLAREFDAAYFSGRQAQTADQMLDALRNSYARHQSEIMAAGEQALSRGEGLTLPGREVLAGAELSAYLDTLRQPRAFETALLAAYTQRLREVIAGHEAALAPGGAGADSNITGAQTLSGAALQADLAGLQATLKSVEQGIFEARNLRTEQGYAQLVAQTYPGLLSLQQNLARTPAAAVNEALRLQAFSQLAAASGQAASYSGVKALPLRLAFYDQGFQAAELAGVGSFSAQPYWPGQAGAFSFLGTLNMTQSSVVTERGGGITLLNPGGAINVGLKKSEAPGVIALGGGDIFAYAQGDFQVNDQRVFVVGHGDMNIWSSGGDIDSGRGANTAVGAPPVAARRSADGMVFELPATTTGSGLGILADAAGQREGGIGLYPAVGEILALDALIRAPRITVGSAIQGGDNVQGSSSGAAAPVAAPALQVPTPPPAATAAGPDGAAAGAGAKERQRNGLLTVDLLGLGDDGRGAPAAGPAAEPPAAAPAAPAQVNCTTPDCKDKEAGKDKAK